MLESYILRFFSYIGTSIVVQPAIIALNRVAKFFFESSVTKEDKTQSIDSIQSIDFCDVSFSYNEDDDVIKNFSMTIKSGDKVTNHRKKWFREKYTNSIVDAVD